MTTLNTNHQIRRSEAARILGVTPASIYRYERQGLLRAFKRNSRMTFYKLGDVLRLQEQGTAVEN